MSKSTDKQKQKEEIFDKEEVVTNNKIKKEESRFIKEDYSKSDKR